MNNKNSNPKITSRKLLSKAGSFAQHKFWRSDKKAIANHSADVIDLTRIHWNQGSKGLKDNSKVVSCQVSPKQDRKVYQARVALLSLQMLFLGSASVSYSQSLSPEAPTIGSGQLSIEQILKTITQHHDAYDDHAYQGELNELVSQGKSAEAFTTAFELGDEIFEHNFTAADGVGANIGENLKFTNVPRADLSGAGEWATHFPKRSTGPNGQSCQACHNQPSGSAAAGSVSVNVVRDPLHTGEIGSFITRNATHTFGSGALQRLAEEMTDELHGLVAAAQKKAKANDASVRVSLDTKGVNFGEIVVSENGAVDKSEVVGVDEDLVVKPFQWKGNEATLRSFVVDASHNELGMQPEEIVGVGVDGDNDGVITEFTVGDVTAMVIYAAAQPRPVTKVEMAALELIPALDQQELEQIMQGEELFNQVGCQSCHTAEMILQDPIFHEPSLSQHYRGTTFNSEAELLGFGVDPKFAVSFDLTKDHLDNKTTTADGKIHSLGSFETTENGAAKIALYGDLKRHDMGPKLAEKIDEVGTGASVFLTKELWGVGDTAPYLHDGRASTLTEAILEHGGEAADSQAQFSQLAMDEQTAILVFLNNLKLLHE